MTLEILVYSLILFMVLFVLGTLLCLRLYRWDYVRFFRSALWTKVYYWVPVFCVFLLMLYYQLWASVLVTCVIVGFAIRELIGQSQKDWVARLYALVISIAIANLILFFIVEESHKATNILLIVGFSSVLSDVCAYFFGNFFGRHKLPIWVNHHKSWEGVVGQLVGAIIGYLLISPVIHPTPHIALAVVIGAASAAGDILNSIVKRRIGIKDWGTTIPGHGGVLDRFASLALAVGAAYWWMMFFI